jgi:hypothetical protein
MYYLDPERGARRRTEARNQLVHASHVVRDNSRAQLQALWQAQDEIDDRTLAERARDILGRVATHAQALALEVSKGVITVSGPILRNEIRRTIKALQQIPGAQRVINALEPHTESVEMRSMGRESRGHARRVATALIGVVSLGLVARAAMMASSRDFELQP